MEATLKPTQTEAVTGQKKRGVLRGVLVGVLIAALLLNAAAVTVFALHTGKTVEALKADNQSLAAQFENQNTLLAEQFEAQNRAFSEQMEAMRKSFEEQQELHLDNGDIAAEDDVVIADEYVIRSTKQISDAYLSGDTSQLSDRDKQTLDLAKSVLDAVITDGMSDYEKEQAVYLWLTTRLHNNTGLLTVIPTTDGGEDNPYGVLRNHSAVCVGYATTFRLLMQMQNIECKVIHSSDRIHSWDLVRLDGDWYHVDCYMDSDNGSMANFNMNDTLAVNNGHEWNTEFFPAAQGLKYSPAMMNMSTVKDIYAVPAFVKDMIENKIGVAGLRFEKKIDQSNEAAASMLVDRLEQTLWNTEYSFNTLQFTWALDQSGDYVLCIFAPLAQESPYDEDVDEETQEKINDAISDAFGDVSYEDPEWEEWDDEEAVG